MEKFLVSVFTLVLILSGNIAGCKSDIDSNNFIPTEAPTVLGEWVHEFERNGAQGKLYIVFTDQRIISYEIGNGLIMDKWFSGLSNDESYKYQLDDHNQYAVTSDGNSGQLLTLTLMSSTQISSISKLPENVVIETWQSDVEATSWPQDNWLYALIFLEKGTKLELTLNSTKEVTTFTRIP